MEMEHAKEMMRKMCKYEEETMCYLTSKKLLDLIPGEPTLITAHDYPSFLSCLQDGVYNIELHITVDGLNMQELRACLGTKGLLGHILKHDEVRLFTHAFNWIIEPNKFTHAQSWCFLQDYHIHREFHGNEKRSEYFHTLGVCIQNYIDDPYSLFEFFGVNRGGVSKLCKLSTFNQLFRVVRAGEMHVKFLVDRV